MRASLRGGLVLVLAGCAMATTACSSAAFDTAPTGDDPDTGATADTGGVVPDTGGDTTPGTDTGVIDDAPSPDSGPPPTDGGGVDGGVGDSIVGEGGTTCSSLPPLAPDLYVDKTSSKPSIGTSDCPFRTIAEATGVTWAGVTLRTIHVSANDYNESNAIEIGRNIKLLGAGATATTLRHGGACPGLSTNCVVTVDPGGILDGVQVLGGGTPVVTGVSSTGGTVAPAVVRTNIRGATAIANIYVRGAADLGPNFTANGAVGLPGLISSGSGTIHVIGTGNAFDKNGQSGISIDGAANLIFDGGSASNNAANGVRLVGNGSYGLTNLDAIGNASMGITVGVNSNMKLRHSTVTQNKVGVIALFGSSNFIDLGSASDAGGNVFTIAGTPRTNVIAAVCVANPRSTLWAIGDSWSACPVTPTFLDGGCSFDAGSTVAYKDVYYAGSAPMPSGGWVDTNGCGVGP